MTTTALPPFEEKPVLSMAARVVGAGDGLSDPMSVSSDPHHHGDEVFLVLRCKVTQVNHKPFGKDDTEHLVRVETFSAVEGTIVDGADVVELLEVAKKRTEEAKARKAEEQREAEEREARLLRPTLDDAESDEEKLEREQAAAEREAKADVDAADELERARGRRAGGRGKQ